MRGATKLCALANEFRAVGAASAYTAAVTEPGTALVVFVARSGLLALSGLGVIRQPEAGESQAGQADAEFLERLAARGGLGQTFGQLIEFVVHTLPFVLFVCCSV
jgi:hypothetical protein